VLVITAVGGYVMFGMRQRRWPGLGFAAVAGLVIASIGVTVPGRDLLRAAIGLWPGFAVLWDGQQYVAPLALAEALGAGLAVAWVASPHAPGPLRAKIARKDGEGGQPRPDRPGLALAALLALAPVLLLPGLAWGAGHPRPVWYPADWLHAAHVMDRSPAQGEVLLLPWAAYRNPAWNGGRTVLDPWPRLLSRQVIWNTGPRVGAIQLRPDDPAAARLDGVISAPGPLTAALEAAGVRFVIVDSGASVAGRLPGCAVIIERPGLVVYQVPGG
jgi:hypothetical protein